MAHRSLDKLDKKILHLIAEDARIPFLEVARSCNVSGAAIHQRIQKLTNLGVLKGSQFVIDPEKIGYETCAYVGLYLKNPEDFDNVVSALRKIPEVVECHYTTGGYDLFIKIYAINNHHLLNIIIGHIEPLLHNRCTVLVCTYAGSIQTAGAGIDQMDKSVCIFCMSLDLIAGHALYCIS